MLPPYRPRCSPSLQPSAINEDGTLAVTTRSSHINRPEPTHGGAGFLTSALLSKVALPQGQNHKQWNSFAYKSTSVVYGTVRAPLHNVFQSNMACTSLLIKPCLETNQTQTRPNKSKPLHRCFRACHTSPVGSPSKLLFPSCFYANLTGRHKMISSGWTVRKEVGSSDSLLGMQK